VILVGKSILIHPSSTKRGMDLSVVLPKPMRVAGLAQGVCFKPSSAVTVALVITVIVIVIAAVVPA
jgi:hypothetical protein